MRALPTFSQGTRVGPYEVVQELGRGGSAAVYLVRCPDGSSRALKARLRGDPELDRRFLREFESLRGLSIPGVVRVHDAGETARHLWFAMDLVQGSPIRRWIFARGDVPERVRAALDVGARLMDALADIHRHGLTHRDLKPSNVLVSDKGEVSVLDFGVVRWWSATGTLTSEGSIVGTLPFMAPEQVAGLALTERVDIFAAGLILYEGILGPRKRPPRPRDWLNIQCLERTPSLACLDERVPRALSALVDRMLSLDPSVRPPAHKVASALRAIARGKGRADWPEPAELRGVQPLVDEVLEVVGGSGPRVCVLVGAAGSGRRRIVERVRRQAMLIGVRSVEGTCRQDEVAAPVRDVLDSLVSLPSDAEWRRQVGGPDPTLLLEMWPDLQLPDGGLTERSQASRRQVGVAAAQALVRASEPDGLLVVLHGLDQVDGTTRRMLITLAREAPPTLTILCTLDPRWAGERAERLVAKLRDERCIRTLSPPLLGADDATALARDLVPMGLSEDQPAQAPIHAVHQGLLALARWRGEPYQALAPELVCLGLLRQPVPAPVLRQLDIDVEAGIASGALRVHDNGRLELDGDVLVAMAQARILDRPGVEERLAAAIEAAWPDGEGHALVATHRLHGTEPERALIPAVKAALHARDNGRTNEARRWLMIVDQLPRSADDPAYARLRFELAHCRAHTSMRTDGAHLREDLVEQATRRAQTREEQARAALLEADLLVRQDRHQPALVRCLKWASHLEATNPGLAADALLQASRIRLDLNQPDDAMGLLDRAEALRGGRHADLGQLRFDRGRAGTLIVLGRAQRCVALCQTALHLARSHGTSIEAAVLQHDLGMALWQLGERERAERETWQAYRRLTRVGRRAEAAEARLQMARLAFEKGDSAGARLMLNEARVTAMELNLVRVLPPAFTLELAISASRGENRAAERAVKSYEQLGRSDPAWAATLADWHRVCGQHESGLELCESAPRGGHAGAWIEVVEARLRLEQGDADQAARTAAEARTLADREGFEELSVMARLVHGAARPKEGDGWDEVVLRATASRWVELFLAAIELDGRRRLALGDSRGAAARFRSLDWRSADLAHFPYAEVAKRQLARLS